MKWNKIEQESDGQQKEFLEKIGDYLVADYDIDEVEEYKFGPRIYFLYNGKRYYVEVGFSDNQP